MWGGRGLTPGASSQGPETRGDVEGVMGEDPDAGAAVEVFGLTSSFGEVHAVAGIDLRVVRPEASLPLLGPNGAGTDDDRLKFWRATGAEIAARSACSALIGLPTGAR